VHEVVQDLLKKLAGQTLTCRDGVGRYVPVACVDRDVDDGQY
jgi:hypothetical protein